MKGGYLDGAVLDDVAANRLADLESREVMLSKIAGMLKSEMAHAAALFVSAQSKFLSTLEAYKAKLPAEVATEEADPAPEADSADDAAVSAAEATPEADQPASAPEDESNEEE